VFLDVEPVVKARDSAGKHRTHTFGVGYASCCHLRKGILESKEVIRFNRPFAFFSWLDAVRDRHKATWVFAHNLGYDLTLLGFWDRLSLDDASIRFAVLEDPPTIIVVKHGCKLIRFVDVMNYWRLSVADLAASVTYGQSAGGNSLCPLAGAAPRCQYHVEVIESCILRLIATVSEMSLCSWQTTAASLAWGVFRKCFLEMNLHPHCNEHARRLERASYFGGRVEARSIGLISEPVSVLDVNSLYPSVMASHSYPTGPAIYAGRWETLMLLLVLIYVTIIVLCLSPLLMGFATLVILVRTIWLGGNWKLPIMMLLLSVLTMLVCITGIVYLPALLDTFTASNVPPMRVITSPY
jgi:hypothetical protein